MKSYKDGQGPKDLLQTHTLTPLEERVLAMRHGLAGSGESRLADGSLGHPDLAAWLRDIERDVLRRAEIARGRTGITAVIQGGAVGSLGARPHPGGRRRHLRVVPPGRG